jgi:hypothetical protein
VFADVGLDADNSAGCTGITIECDEGIDAVLTVVNSETDKGVGYTGRQDFYRFSPVW